MRFTKMHGLGNDYVFLDGFRDPLPGDLADVARAVSDRHFGIGGDGLIAFEPSATADARMRIHNADGSEAEMCGNGLRCVAKALFDRGHVDRPRCVVETGRGPLAVENLVVDGRVESVRVDMGPPRFESEPRSIDVDGQRIELHVVSMGNPHAVLFVEEPTDDLVRGLGPRIEMHPAFPERTNVEFVRVDGPESLTVRVWERGSGETLACGTGACAAVVAATLVGRVDGRATVHLPGGDLDVDWTERRGVITTGPAIEVFTGDWTPPVAVPRAA